MWVQTLIELCLCKYDTGVFQHHVIQNISPRECIVFSEEFMSLENELQLALLSGFNRKPSSARLVRWIFRCCYAVAQSSPAIHACLLKNKIKRWRLSEVPSQVSGFKQLESIPIKRLILCSQTTTKLQDKAIAEISGSFPLEVFFFILITRACGDG